MRLRQRILDLSKIPVRVGFDEDEVGGVTCLVREVEILVEPVEVTEW